MPLLEARGVNVVYEPSRGQRIWSVRDVDLSLEEGEFVGLVGESGCGKSTLGFALTRMLRPPARLSGGVINFDGTDSRAELSTGFTHGLCTGLQPLHPGAK